MSSLVATGSMDTTAKLWDIQSGQEAHTLTVQAGEEGSVWHLLGFALIPTYSPHKGHTSEVICVGFSTSGDQVLTGSFDHTAILWDVATGK